MDIFVDTSAIYTDPFWKRNFSRLLMDAAKNDIVKLYFSDVVLRELRRNFEKQLEKEFAGVASINLSLKKLTRQHEDIAIAPKEAYLNDFDRFYEDLVTTKTIIKLPADKNNFDEILERAIQRRKPFTDSRSEFKDAVIWTTYYKYAQSRRLEECYLVTNNVKDFTDTEGRLHPELLADYEKFRFYLTLEEFYKAKKETIEMEPVVRFKQWLDEKPISEAFVFKLITDQIKDDVVDAVKAEFEGTDPTSVSDDREYWGLLGGYVDVEDIVYSKCESIDVDVVKDYAIISGILYINASLALYGYNSVRDPGDEKFPYFGSVEKDLKVYFNFIYDKDELPKNFEVTDVTSSKGVNH